MTGLELLVYALALFGVGFVCFVIVRLIRRVQMFVRRCDSVYYTINRLDSDRNEIDTLWSKIVSIQNHYCMPTHVYSLIRETVKEEALKEKGTL